MFFPLMGESDKLIEIIKLSNFSRIGMKFLFRVQCVIWYLHFIKFYTHNLFYCSEEKLQMNRTSIIKEVFK